MAWWSNYGSCVDLTGPGVDVPLAQTHYHISDYYFAQTYVDDDEQLIAISSGTSFSTPITSGVFALFLQRFDGNVSMAKSALFESATRGSLYMEPGLCPSNDRLLRAPFEGDTISQVQPIICDEPESRIGWPFFYNNPEYASYSYDFGCADTCYRIDNCSQILETNCNNTCTRDETQIIYDTVCIEVELVPTFNSYSYSYNDNLVPEEPWVRPVKVPRQSVRATNLEPGNCLELVIPASASHYYSYFAFRAVGGDFATVFVSNTSLSDCTLETSNSQGVPICDYVEVGDDILLQGKISDPTTHTVRASICKYEDSTDGFVDLTLFAIHSLRDREFIQDTTKAIPLGTTFDLMLPSTGRSAQLAGYETGECGLLTGSSLLSQRKPNYFNRTFVDLDSYLSIIGLSSPYDGVEHVRCTLLISRTASTDAGEETTLPTYSPTPEPVSTTSTPTYNPTPIQQKPTTLIPTTQDLSGFVPSTFIPTGRITNQPSSVIPSLRPTTVAPSLNLYVLVTSHFIVSGTTIEESISHTDFYAQTVAEVMVVDSTAVQISFEISGSRRRLLEEAVLATYSIITSFANEQYLVEKCYAVTATELDAALHEVAPTLSSSVEIIATSNEVFVTYHRGSFPSPTATPSVVPHLLPTVMKLPPSGDDRDLIKAKSKGGHSSSPPEVTLILIAIFVPLVTLVVIAAGVYFYIRRKRRLNEHRYPFDILLPSMEHTDGSSIQLT